MASHHTASYSRGHLGLAAALLRRPGDDVVVDVGDVRHVTDLEAPELEVAAEHVEDEGEAAVAEVRDVVDGRATDVHRHAALLAQFEGADRARRRVVEAQHSEYGNRTVDTTVDVTATTEVHPPQLEAPRPPRCPTSPPSRASRPNGRPGGRRRAPTASTGPPRAPGSSPSTRRPPPCRARCTSVTCSPTPTPTPWPASGACGATTSSTRWVGTTTAFPPSAGCRTTTASAATRPAS